jgi:hypothetical protein
MPGRGSAVWSKRRTRQGYDTAAPHYVGRYSPKLCEECNAASYIRDDTGIYCPTCGHEPGKRGEE